MANKSSSLEDILSIGEEVIGREELVNLLNERREYIAYDGFEPSGQIHLAQSVLKSVYVNRFINAGFRYKMLIADWHALANDKFGGDLNKIQTTGKYFIEVWKAAGMNLDKVDFVWASDLVKSTDYWLLVLKIAKTNSINRFIRTAEIMGRSEKDELTGAQILYPCMQIADIFTLGADVAQLGMDQRKVNVLAREIAPQLGYPKPIVVSHHMLIGLLRYQIDENSDKVERTIALKMSKSKPDSAIFVTDDTETIARKINRAWCPEGIVHENPILEYFRYIVFMKFNHVIIERPAKWGGSISYSSYPDLENDFREKKVHPADMKTALIKYIDELLQPIRDHFTRNEYASSLLRKVMDYTVTR
jgi:tyrosyl-tRNA synthetase